MYNSAIFMYILCCAIVCKCLLLNNPPVMANSQRDLKKEHTNTNIIVLNIRCTWHAWCVSCSDLATRINKII